MPEESESSPGVWRVVNFTTIPGIQPDQNQIMESEGTKHGFMEHAASDHPAVAGLLLAGSLMAYLKQSPLVGYLLAGMVMGGPGSMAIVKAEQQIESIAELGVALLLFSLGLEFSWKRVMGLGKATLLCGAAQVIVTLLVVAICCRLFGITPQHPSQSVR